MTVQKGQGMGDSLSLIGRVENVIEAKENGSQMYTKDWKRERWKERWRRKRRRKKWQKRKRRKKRKKKQER